MGTIKEKVAIIGMGCKRFGELWDKSTDDLIVDASYEACEDAGVDLKNIEAAWLGTVFSGHTAVSLSAPLSWQYKPVTRVENMCATGTEALRAAAYAIVTRADMANRFRSDPIYIKSLAASGGPQRDPIDDTYDFTHVEENVRAAQMAHQEAGITDPRKELSVAEIHDCFTISAAGYGAGSPPYALPEIKKGDRKWKNMSFNQM